ncbi:lipopolysaccharide 3-alpha-galactosyltransferase [Symbiopectobacterium purcellii]|uniref:lipopolysaccharide 3-alpha-galactosyltransferase n=1 Tax=Symbiopectobacterium purcellii TaxID=2871826 RepID=UPI003F83FE56
MYFTPQTVIIKKLVLNENISLDASKKTLNIAYGIDKNFIFGCGISIASILLNNKQTNFTFHVFTDFFDKKNREEFTKLSHQYNAQIIIYIVNCDELKSLPSTKNWSYATYFRFIIADYFYELKDKILYLDADIICNGNVDELVELELDNYLAAVVTEGESPWWTKRAQALRDDRISAGYFNAGFLLINVAQWGKEDISRQAMTMLDNDEVKNRISFLDQDILNMLFVDKVLFLSKKYNNQYSINYELNKNKDTTHFITDNAIFIHYIGPTKPWHEWADYPNSHCFQIAKSHSPWANSPLEKARSSTQLRYCAKHYAHKGNIFPSLISYAKYFTKKLLAR